MQQIFHLMFLLRALVIQCFHDVIVGYVIVIAIAKIIMHAIVIVTVPIVIAIDIQ